MSGNATGIQGTFLKNNEQIAHAQISKNANGELIIVDQSSQNFQSELSSGETIWFQLAVNAGQHYKFWWQDSWWEEYTAGSIFVTVFSSDTSMSYFPEANLIQMTGCPRYIYCHTNDSLLIRVRGFNNEEQGSFAVHADPIYEATIDTLVFDSIYHDVVQPGEINLYSVTLMQDSTYFLKALGSQWTGAYGQEVQVGITLLAADGSAAYYRDDYVHCPFFEHPDTIRHFTANYSGKYYIALEGAYWWEPRLVSLQIGKD